MHQMILLLLFFSSFFLIELYSFRIGNSRVLHSSVSNIKLSSTIKSDAVVGLEAPVELVNKSAKELEAITEVDYVVIGSGIGGLSAAALLSYYNYSVVVLESHYLPGGVAHTFVRNGFHFGEK